MDFDKQLSEEQCQYLFAKMFGNIWTCPELEKIVFPGGFKNSKAFDNFQSRNLISLQNESCAVTEFQFIAEYFGNSLWEIFSNNHTVFSIENNTEFSIGSWRGSGSFIAGFIEKQNKELQFDYMAFYMGHFHEDAEAKNSYEFIFSKLSEHGFDWNYEYPSIGMVDFSPNKPDNHADYNANQSLENEISKNNFLDLINKINEEQKDKINKAPTPAIIIAYANIYKKYPEGWEDI
ncbi:hypothetical protein [Parafilimonas sp.]|uniref:hypothetical protein n=1 Tax=Parafilimonas sp. TaxID=1969739 RepID=UPI0039E4C96D